MYLTAVGSKFFYSTSFGLKKTVDSVTNADPAVATSTAHGFANGKELLLINGWEDASESIWRAASVAANTVTLEDLDTSDTEWFPSGTASSGTLQEVSNWQEIGQVLDVASTGGGRRDITVSPLARRNSIVLPAGFEASGIDFTLGFDPSRVDQKAMDKISRRLSQRVAFKFVLPGGAKLYAYGFLQKSGLPQMASQDVMKVNVSCSFLGMVSTYVDV